MNSDKQIKPATPLSVERKDRPTDGYRVRHLVDAKGATLAVFTETKAPDEVAAYIVHACNAYPKLVEALRAMCGDGVHNERESLSMARALLHSLGEG